MWAVLSYFEAFSRWGEEAHHVLARTAAPRTDMTSEIGPTFRRCHSGSSALSGVRAETRAALEAMCRPRRLCAGQTVIHEGETSDYVGCVLSGILRLQKTLADGRQHIVGLLVEGDMFGRVFDAASDFSVEAATDVEFCAFPRGRFETLLSHAPDLDRALLLNILNELDRARDWMVLLSNRKISSRLAGFLVLLCSRFASIDRLFELRPDGLEIRVPISRTDLAHLLGTRTESISRAFHWLEDKGDIEILDPDRVLVRDVAALASRTGDDETDEIASLKAVLASRRTSG